VARLWHQPREATQDLPDFTGSFEVAGHVPTPPTSRCLLLLLAVREHAGSFDAGEVWPFDIPSGAKSDLGTGIRIDVSKKKS
jgi:hypothetical protein